MDEQNKQPGNGAYSYHHKSMRKLDIALLPDEHFVGMGVSEYNQLVVWSNKKRVWISTDAPIEHLDMLEITGINKENRERGL